MLCYHRNVSDISGVFRFSPVYSIVHEFCCFVLLCFSLVYIHEDAANNDLRYACGRRSCGLNICCIVIEGGFNNVNGSSSLKSLNPHIV